MSAIQRFIASQGLEVASWGVLKLVCVIGPGFCRVGHSSHWRVITRQSTPPDRCNKLGAQKNEKPPPSRAAARVDETTYH